MGVFAVPISSRAEKAELAVNFPLQCEFSTGGGGDYAGAEPSVMGLLTMAEAARRTFPGNSCWCEGQVAHSDQVVGGQCQAEHPIDSRDSAVPGLAQPAYSLEPAEDLFHPFALALTELVPRVARGALVNDTGLLAREMRGDPMLAHFLHQLFAVVTFVGAQGDPAPAWNLLHHRQCRFGFGVSGRFGYAAVDRQPMTILH